MQALMSESGEVVIVRLCGRIDVETAEPFRRVCMGKLIDRPVVFDFRQLNFVGSAGIVQFLRAMQEYLVANPKGFKFSSVGVEFKKVFAASPLNAVEIFEDYDKAVEAFVNPALQVRVAAQAAPTLNEQEFISLSIVADEKDVQ